MVEWSPNTSFGAHLAEFDYQLVRVASAFEVPPPPKACLAGCATNGPAAHRSVWPAFAEGFGSAAFARFATERFGWLAEPKLAYHSHTRSPPSPSALRRGSLLSLR